MSTSRSRCCRCHSLVLLVLVTIALVTAATAQAAPPKRIVALTPFSANTLAELGVEPVAIGETLGGRDRYSPKLEGVETLTLSHPNGPNMEELAVLNPQLVLSSPTWAKGAKTMRDLEIEVVDSDPRSIADVFAQTRRIGKLVGRDDAAKELAAKLRRQVAKARRGIARRPRVLLVLGVGRTPFVCLPNSWGGDLVSKAGGRLLTAGARSRSGFARISDEAVLAADPDVILAIPHADSDDIPEIAKFLRANPAWKDSKAVKSGRLHVSTDNSLLQAGTDVAAVIRKLRRSYLDN